MDLLKKLIKEYEEKLNNSLEIMKELDKELEENDGQYPDIEFGQNYESEDTALTCYENFLLDLKKLQKSIDHKYSR